MLRKIWQWLKNLYQRWFTKPTPPPPPPPPPPNTEYENLFSQLLEKVSQGASRGKVKGFLISHNLKEAELIAWLERFRTKLETNPPANPAELSRHLQQLNQLGLGELSSLAGNIAQQLSGGSPQPPFLRGAEEGISGSPLFKGGGGGDQIFHFTGHGVHDLDNPDNSGLQMADGELLTMRDLFDKLQLPPYMLVCLSACETGIASQKDLIDEFVGLTSPFLTAKTTHIVSTLWSVEEISTCMLMIEFFRRFRAGKPGNIALAEAKAWLRTATNSKLSQWCEARAEELTEEHPNYETFDSDARNTAAANPDECPYEHPYFWAGFTVTGKVN